LGISPRSLQVDVAIYFGSCKQLEHAVFEQFRTWKIIVFKNLTLCSCTS